MNLERSNVLITPPMHRELAVKLSCNGVTVLKDGGRFKKRLNGSRSHTMLPDGTLIANKILRELQPALIQPSKKPPGKKIDADPATLQEPKEPREYSVNKKLIRQRVYAFLLGQRKPQLYGITVSFPPCVTDELAYRALNIWLTRCRQSLKLENFLWVAERQGVGTIHYHILIPQYFNVQRANKFMADTLANFVRKGDLNWNLHAAKRYNGVDISKNRNTKRVTNFALGSNSKALALYITKYISKNENGRNGEKGKPFTRLAWHNSRGFSSVFTSVALTEAEAKYLQLRSYLNMERVFTTEYAVFIGWHQSPAAIFTRSLQLVNDCILNKGDPDLLKQKLFCQLN
jgi:hypothetical protein